MESEPLSRQTGRPVQLHLSIHSDGVHERAAPGLSEPEAAATVASESEASVNLANIEHSG